MNTKTDYNTFLAAVRKETGLDAFVADETGLVSVRVQDAYNLNLQFVEVTGKILLFVEVVELPSDAPAAVYRDLLVGGLFGRDTAGGYFALEPLSDTVVYNYFFDFDKASADVDGFVATIEKILQLCDVWASRIKSGLSSAHGEVAEAHSPHFPGSMIRA